ncbi:MAG TPA: c-type cytochrome domain-containing protein [Tepidisphaeraceae bacterium]
MRLCVFAAAFLFCGIARASDDKPVSYYRDVRPIFVSDCNACHKPEKNKGELDMTTFAALMKGGKHGSSIVPGDPGKSKLVEMISGDDPDMPKDGDSLKKDQVATISRWIKEGAKDDTPAAGSQIVATPVYTVPPVISALAYSPDGSVLAVSGYHEILLHKPDGSGLIARLIGESPRIESLAFSKDGKQLAACGGAPAELGQVQIWDPLTRKAIKTFDIGTDELYGVSFAPDEKSVACGGADKIVHRIDLATGKEMLDFRAHADWVLGTQFTHDGKQLVSAGRDKAMKLIDLESGRFIDDINNPLEACISLAIHPKEEQILYGGDLGTARLYRISDNQGRTAGRNDTNLLKTFEHQAGPVTAVAFSPDGNMVALGSMGAVRVYSVNAPDKAALTLSGFAGPVYALAYQPDGNALAAGGAAGSVYVFDAKTGNLRKSFVPVPLTSSSADALPAHSTSSPQ